MTQQPNTPAPVEKAAPSTLSKAAKVHAIVNTGPYPGMSEAFNDHMGAECWTDPAYAPDASMWAAAWKAALKAQQAAQPVAGEPVMVEAVAEVVDTDDGLTLRWLIEGGIAAMADGCVLVMPHSPITGDDGSGEVYTAAPAPVGLVPLTYDQIVDALVDDAGLNLAFRSYEDDMKFASAIVDKFCEVNGIKAGKDVAK